MSSASVFPIKGETSPQNEKVDECHGVCSEW